MPQKKLDYIPAGNCVSCRGTIELVISFQYPPFTRGTPIGPSRQKIRKTKLVCRECGQLYDHITRLCKLLEHQLDRIQLDAKKDCRICLGYGYCQTEKSDEVVPCPECSTFPLDPKSP